MADTNQMDGTSDSAETRIEEIKEDEGSIPAPVEPKEIQRIIYNWVQINNNTWFLDLTEQ